jgi:hypothetical protein
MEERDLEDQFKLEERLTCIRQGKSSFECIFENFSPKDNYEIDIYTPSTALEPYGSSSLLGMFNRAGGCNLVIQVVTWYVFTALVVQ